jgi:hypothetical protein
LNVFSSRLSINYFVKGKKKKGTKSEEEKGPSAFAGSIDLGFEVLGVKHSTT